MAASKPAVAIKPRSSGLTAMLVEGPAKRRRKKRSQQSFFRNSTDLSPCVSGTGTLESALLAFIKFRFMQNETTAVAAVAYKF